MRNLLIEVIDFSTTDLQISQIILKQLKEKGINAVYNKRNIGEIEKIWENESNISYCISSQGKNMNDPKNEIYLFAPPNRLIVKSFDMVLEMLLTEQQTQGEQKPILEVLNEPVKRKEKEPIELITKTSFATIRRLFKCTDRFGYTSEEILNAERKFFMLPRVLMDYYAELGASDTINRTHDRLLGPKELRFTERFLVFYEECNKKCVWGIHRRDLKKKNPPVYFSEDETELESWRIESDNLTDFLDVMSCAQAIFALDYCCEEVINISQREAQYIRERFRSRSKKLSNWTRVEFFGNYWDSVIALMPRDDRFDMLYASSDEIHFQKMHKILTRLG